VIAARVSYPVGVVRGLAERRWTAMFTIEEDSGTYTGSLRRHNGYYAGDFSGTPMCSDVQLAALARLRPPAFPIGSGHAD
jgi:hypothetical protein